MSVVHSLRGWCLLAAFFVGNASAQALVEAVADVEAAPIRDLEAVVVHGAQPGPGLWRVSKDGHVLWILGTVSPLPNQIEWRADEVRAVIARSGQVLLPPGVAFDADVGFFGKVALLPTIWKGMRNEDGAELNDVLAPAIYARWAAVKQRYLPRDGGIERKRPMFAAVELQSAAMKSIGLGRRKIVWPVVDAAAKAAGITPTPTTWKIMIDDPKAAVREFREGGIDDAACLERTVALIEHDLPTLVERANAWAVGDIEALRRSPYEDAGSACMQAVTESGFVRNRGYGDLRARVRQHWLSIAEAALQRNEETFAMLPVDRLLETDGYLAQLQARGYEVELP
ncbi:TraB/GumN family protein [Stenotrophomonas terrae]|uniref:TraB/GumN family protein n=1 Tax=Stenotrophomonas terrae TaxID=405446 RepID=UPI0009F84270|nr:TraB/GumN family protein [Stenotrophomonas terrae]